MSSPKYNKAKGAAFEIDVMKWFRGLGVLAERLRLAGKDDEGDLVVLLKQYLLLFRHHPNCNLQS